MTAMLRGRRACCHRRMWSICWPCFLLFHMAATAGAATVASFNKTVPDTTFTLSLGWVVMLGNFDIAVLPCRGGGGGRAGRRERRLVDCRRVCLLSRGFNNPVTAVLWLMGVEREMSLLRMVAVMVVEMRVALNWEFGSTIAIIVRVWGSPYLALLRSSGMPFILVGKAMWLVSPLACPLLLLVGKHPATLVRKITVVAPTAHVVMRVVAASLGPNLSANWRWSLIGSPRVGAWLLNGSQSTLSHAVWRSVTPKEEKYKNKISLSTKNLICQLSVRSIRTYTFKPNLRPTCVSIPGSFGAIIILQSLFLPEGGCQPTALASTREDLRPPGQLRIHRGGPTVRMPWMLLLPVKGVRTRSSRI